MIFVLVSQQNSLDKSEKFLQTQQRSVWNSASSLDASAQLQWVWTSPILKNGTLKAENRTSQKYFPKSVELSGSCWVSCPLCADKYMCPFELDAQSAFKLSRSGMSRAEQSYPFRTEPWPLRHSSEVTVCFQKLGNSKCGKKLISPFIFILFIWKTKCPYGGITLGQLTSKYHP